MKFDSITGVILCGGKSSRMKTNKALLKLNNKTVIDIILDKMKLVFDKIILSTNNPELYSNIKLPIVQDVYLNKGPLAGIHSALSYSSTERNFIISCDMPLITIELIIYLCDIITQKKIILPAINGRIQQLCGLYSKSLIVDIEEVISLSEQQENYKGSVYELIGKVSAETIDVKSLPFYNENIFLNMNTPEDYEQIKKIYQIC